MDGHLTSSVEQLPVAVHLSSVWLIHKTGIFILGSNEVFFNP